MYLILNLYLSGIMTIAGRFILFSFKVILVSFQSISMMSYNLFLFKLMCSGISFPVLLNVCILPAGLHNFTCM